MSTAAVERLFSILNLKQQERSRLEILNELLLIRFNTEPGGHLDESSHMVVLTFSAVKKRMGGEARLTTLKSNCPLPSETSKHQLPPSESNEIKKRREL